MKLQELDSKIKMVSNNERLYGSGSFARGKEQKITKASMIFVGNIDGSIENIVKTSFLSPFQKR